MTCGVALKSKKMIKEKKTKKFVTTPEATNVTRSESWEDSTVSL